MYVPGLGVRVSHPASEVLTIGDFDLYAITGGAVIITYIVGRVVTQLGNFGAGELLLQYDQEPNNLAQPFCASAAVDADDVGTRYHCQGQFDNPLIVIVPYGAGAGHTVQGGWMGGDMSQAGDMVALGWFCPPGHIQAVLSVSNLDGTGTIAWELFYIPLEAGSVVVTE